MSRYKLTISCEFDSAYPMTAHTEEARALVTHCCPQEFGFIVTDSFCSMSNCRECWFKALEEGELSDATKSVHVERLD